MKNTEKKPAHSRTKVARRLINKLPEGYRKCYLKTLRHNLFMIHDILLSEQQLSSFFQNGYSSVADTILLVLRKMVNSILRQERLFAEKLAGVC